MTTPTNKLDEAMMTDELILAELAKFPTILKPWQKVQLARALLSASKPAAQIDRHAVMRLKSCCRKLGLANAIPEEIYSDPECLFTIFGYMRTQIDVLLGASPAAPAQSGEADDERRPNDDAIARSKRILALVDIYMERPDRMNRNALRSHLFDEFTEAAGIVPQPTQPAKAGEAVKLTDLQRKAIDLAANGHSLKWEEMSALAEITNEWGINTSACESAVVLDDERAAFEVQYERALGHKPERSYASYPHGNPDGYESSHANSAWKWWKWSWQARAASPQADALYTMDQMRDYALAFHKSRLDATADKESGQGVFSIFNACMYRDECRARATATQALTADDADMVWSQDDGEIMHGTLDDAVEYEIQKAWPVEGPIEFTFQVAKRISDVTIRVTGITEDGHEWEIVTAAQAVNGETK